MKPFVPLPPKEVQFDASGLGGTVAIVGFVVALIGLCMGLAA